MYPTKKLSEICDIQNGYAFDANLFSEATGFPIIRIRDLKNSTIQTLYKWEIKDNFIVKKWDYLIWMDWEFRCYEWNNSDALLNQRVCRIINYHQAISPKFLFYWINKYLREIEDVTPFVTVKHISSKQIKDIGFPLPPLPTQSKIVAKLDEAFGNIDHQISLLKENIEDVESVRKSAMEESFQWAEVQKKLMKDVLVTCEYGSSKKSTEDDSWIPVLRMWNIQNGWVVYDNLKYTSKESDDLPKLYLKKFDLLFNRTNSWELVGKTGIFLWEDDTISFAWYLIRLRFSPDISPIYANYYFNSEYFRKTQIEPQIDQQCGQANFSGWKLKETEFLYYSLPRQHEIVEHLDRVFSRTAELRSGYEAQIRDLETLRQSLLEEAFAGRLVSE
jgi:type I restriction enzyme S subunit